MSAKFDVPSLNLKVHDLFDIGKSFFVKDHENKNECDVKIAELVKMAIEAKAAMDGGGLSVADIREVSRNLEKIEIAKNFFTKALRAFTSVEDARKSAEKALAEKRKEKEAMIAKRQMERRKHITPEEILKKKIADK